MPRQDKTIHDKTRQDKTRHDKTKTRQDKTRQDKTRHDKTRQDKTSQDFQSTVCACFLPIMTWVTLLTQWKRQHSVFFNSVNTFLRSMIGSFNRIAIFFLFFSYRYYVSCFLCYDQLKSLCLHHGSIKNLILLHATLFWSILPNLGVMLRQK